MNFFKGYTQNCKFSIVRNIDLDIIRVNFTKGKYTLGVIIIGKSKNIALEFDLGFLFGKDCKDNRALNKRKYFKFCIEENRREIKKIKLDTQDRIESLELEISNFTKSIIHYEN